MQQSLTHSSHTSGYRLLWQFVCSCKISYRPWGGLQFSQYLLSTNFMHSCFKTLCGLRTGQGICIDRTLLIYRTLFKAPYPAVPSQRPFSQSSCREERWAISRGGWRLMTCPKAHSSGKEAGGEPRSTWPSHVLLPLPTLTPGYRPAAPLPSKETQHLQWRKGLMTQ